MKKYLISILIIITPFLCYYQINCKKGQIHKRKHQEINSSNFHKTIKFADEIRPSDVSRELFCDVCQAVIIEALTNLRNLYKESDILFYLTNEICLQKNFNNYHFSKPELEIGCEIFFGQYADAIQKLLMERNPKTDTKEKLINSFCYDQIKACNGVELKNIKPIESKIINGELYDIENVEENYRVYPTIMENNYGEESFKEKNKSEL